MQVVATAVAVLAALAYFGFYAARIADPAFMVIVLLGVVPMIWAAVQDARNGT